MLALLCFAVAALSGASAIDCCFDVNSDLPDSNVPLFLQRGTLMHPAPYAKKGASRKTGLLCVRSGDTFTLACPAKTQVTVGETVGSKVTCVGKKEIQLHSKSVQLSRFKCPEAVTSIIHFTRETCGNSGRILEVGFEVGTKFHEMYTVCHQINSGNTLYSMHTIPGAIDAAMVTGSNKFKRGDTRLFSGYDPDTLYQQASTKKMLIRTLGQAKADKILKISYLARGHLAPAADFLFTPWQRSTYYFANAAPQWQSFNNGNWVEYEKTGRKLASLMNSDLIVMTGTYGVLTLKNDKGVPTPLYLEDSKKQIPIPAYMWKVFQDPKSKKAIAIVGSNDILFENKNMLCKDICRANRWITLTDVKKGYVYCCAVEDLRKTVDFIPKFTVLGVLQGPY